MIPVKRPPVLKRIARGNALAKSLAGETTFAAMLTASVATTAVNMEIATTTGALNCATSWTGSQIARPKMITVALVIKTPIAAKIDIVVGSATTWPTICSRWLRPNRVKSGMLSDSVAQNPIIAVSDGTNTGQNSPNVWNFPGWDSRGPIPFAFDTAHQSSTPVMTSTNGAAQFSTSRRRS